MADRLPNLDPALGGGSQRQYTTDRPDASRYTGQNDSYSTDTSRPIPAYSDPAQPYFQYSPGQQDASAGSTNTPQQTQPYESPSNQQSPQGVDPLRAQDDSKRQRACEACRGLKVRCDQDPERPDVPCKRCAKAGRACIITQPSRKRQKKADTRVAELEKKLDALTAALEHRHAATGVVAANQLSQAGVSSSSQHTPLEPVRHVKTCDSIYEPTNPKRRRIDDAVTEEPNPLSMNLQRHEDKRAETMTAFYDMSVDDIRARINALIPFQESSELFKRYNDVMTQHLPMVVFPLDTTAERVYREKPMLYFAVLTAGAGMLTSRELPVQLQREAVSLMADCVIKHGLKSLELVQAMLIMAGWYKPVERSEQTIFYQLIHMAAVMALDIGLDRRYTSRKTKTPFGKQEIGFSSRLSPQDAETLEARRAWLGCYYLCATSSMVLRRPNLVRWTEYMKESIEMLETSPDAHPSDKLFCQHIKIQHICEEIGLQFLMDDSTAQVSINDPKVTYALVTLESQLKKWKQQVPDEAQCASLTFFEHVTSLYLHEIALHINHNVEDFRLPFTEESIKNVDKSTDTLTQNQIAAIEACVIAAHGILDTMISFTPDELLSLPLLLFFVRCVYALVVLLKMHVAISTPGSELGKLMQSKDLKVGYYLDALIENFMKVTNRPSRKPEKALMILNLLREWFTKHNETLNKQDAGDGAAKESTQQKADQTPLHMLSQVAAGQQEGNVASDDHIDWSINTPTMINYSRSPGDQRNPKPTVYQPQQNVLEPQVNNMAYGSVMFGMGDASNQYQNYQWGSGFEQAMDMTMGNMGDLQGGLDSWFLGENAAPFVFTDVAGASTVTNEQAAQW